ncbi:hypothetical protein DL765_009288 [Monosporascus sp. GIB2]|nr:hypothetical protein DL765_009288 [Monosporascus sp. GIB2]
MQLYSLVVPVLFFSAAQAWRVAMYEAAIGCSPAPNSRMRVLTGSDEVCFNFGEDMPDTQCYQYTWLEGHQVPAGPDGTRTARGSKP